MYVEQRSVRGVRIGAAVIDYIFYTIINTIVAIIVSIFSFSSNYNPMIENSPDSSFLITYGAILFQIIFSFLYFTLLPYLFGGRSIGKLMTGIKVVSYNYQKATFWKLLFRNVYFLNALFIQGIGIFVSYNVSFFFNFLFGLIGFIINLVIFIMILATADCRAIHDLLAGTMVVSTKFDINKVNDVSILERKNMEWAEFDDGLQLNNSPKDHITILNKDEDDIAILKEDKKDQ